MTRRLSVGDTAPRFTLPDARGGEVALEPDAAAATVVVFTANGCPYALAWHDRIQQVARDYTSRDVTVIQVVSNDETGHPEDSVASMRKRVENGEIAGPYLRDGDQEAVAAYGATATPEVFVLDRKGVVRYHGAPDADHDDPAQNAQWVRDALDDILAGTAVRRPQTSPAGCSTKWRVELLWWEGCPSGEPALELLTSTLAELHRGDVTVVRREVTTPEEASRLNFPGLADLPGRAAGPVPGGRRARPELPRVPRSGRPGLAAARPRGARRPAPRFPRPPLGPARLGRSS